MQLILSTGSSAQSVAKRGADIRRFTGTSLACSRGILIRLDYWIALAMMNGRRI